MVLTTGLCVPGPCALAVMSWDPAPSPGSPPRCLQRQTHYPEDNSEHDPQPLWLTRSPPTIRNSKEIILPWLRWASPNTLLRIIFVGPPFADCHSIWTSKVILLSEYVLLILLERPETASRITAAILKLASNRIHFLNHISVDSFFIIVLWPRL